jgi:hypothetical protein
VRTEPVEPLALKGKAARVPAHRLAGRSEEAAEAARRALEIWERKGIVACVERARTLLAELQVAK